MRFPLRWLAVLGLGGCAVVHAADPAPDAAPDAVQPSPVEAAPLDPALPTVFVAGDSTAARNSGRPIQGWAVPFADYLDPARVNLANRARGGRSSRTFLTEGRWERLLGEVKPGDFVLIQFGHNDGGAINEEPPGSTRPLRARGSLPGLGAESAAIVNAVTHQPEVVRTFGWYLRKMIADTRAKGATPVLLSPTVRHRWQDGKIERAAGPHREWTRQLAAAEGAAFVDVSRLLADHFQELGPEEVGKLFAGDPTHTNPAGADAVARAVLAGLLGLRGGPFAGFVAPRGAAIEPDRIGWLNLPEPARTDLPSLLLIGDSTVRNGRGDGADGQWGWGEPLAARFDPARLNVVNRAVGGLSSRTFLTQGHWARARMLLRPGDVVVMQFGHNDSSPVNDARRARGTLPGTGEETEVIDNLLTRQPEVVHTYGWYLRRFIREARAAGATPVVASPVPRREWRDGHIVRADGTHGGWARAVAEEEGAPFVDLNERIARRYEELGPEAVLALFADEHTHTSRAGAELNAEVVAAALRAVPGLLPVEP